MPPNHVASKPSTPSVIARLMGLDELQPQQPVRKRKHKRVLSENYRRKVASIGVWEKKSCDEPCSFRFGIEEQGEFRENGPSFNESFAVAEFIPVGTKLQTLNVVHSGQSGSQFVNSRKECIENHFRKPNYPTMKLIYDKKDGFSHQQALNVRFLESACAFGSKETDIYRKVWGRTGQENPKLLQKQDNCFVKDSPRIYEPDTTCFVSRFHHESNNKRRPSFRKSVNLRPKSRKVDTITNQKDKGIDTHRKGNLHDQLKERKNVCNGMKHMGHRSILSCETGREIFLKQDLSEETSMVSMPLKHDTVHSESENKITAIDQWNTIKDRNVSVEGCLVPESSMCTAASPSIATDMVVTVETADVAEATQNHDQYQFESTGCIMSEKDYDSSSLCISSSQEDISMKISSECSLGLELRVNSETTYQPSPVSVSEARLEEEILLNSECLQSVTASLHDVRQQLVFPKPKLLQRYSEGHEMVVSSGNDNDRREESLKDCEVKEHKSRLLGVEENRDFSYLIDALTEAGFHSKNQDIVFDQWHFPEIQISPSVFDTIEKKYGEQISWTRSARRLLFDQINSGLIKLLQPCFGEPMWAKPVARRLSHKQNLKEIEEHLYTFLVSHEKEAIKNSSEEVFGKDDGWLFLGYDVEVICKEIVNLLIDELVEEIVSPQSS